MQIGHVKYCIIGNNKLKQFKILGLFFWGLSNFGTILGMEKKSFKENFILVDNEGYKITNGEGKNFDFKEIQDEDLKSTKSLKFTVAQIERGNIKTTLSTLNEEDNMYYKVLMIEGKIAIHKGKLYLNKNHLAQEEVNIQCKCVSANLLDGMFLEKIQNTNLINKEKISFQKENANLKYYQRKN